MSLSLWVYGLRFRDEGSWIRVEGVWFGVKGLDTTLRPLVVGQGAYALGFWFGGWLIVHEVKRSGSDTFLTGAPPSCCLFAE